MNFDKELLDAEIQKLDPIQWRNELKKELDNQSDRAVAIVCASILDVQLSQVLETFMIKEKDVKKDLLEGNSPLSTFSAKIKISYYLGLISEDEYKNIETIRKIRNDFAHQLINISFNNNQSIKDRCNNLYIPKNRFVPEEIPLPKEDGTIPKLNLNPFAKDNSPKNRFVQVFYFLSLNLLQRDMEIQDSKRKKYEQTMTTAEHFRKMQSIYKRNRDQVFKLQSQNEELREVSEPKEKVANELSEAQKELLQVVDQTIELFGHIADVLENSYEKDK